MEKKIAWIVILAVVACLLLVNLAFSQTPIKWKGQNAYVTQLDVGPFKGNAAGGGGSVALTFAEWLSRESNGQVQLSVAAPGAIVPIPQMFSAVSKGALDFGGLYYGGFHSGLMPETDIEIGLPFAWETPEEAWDAYYNRGLLQEIRKIYAEHNLYWIPQISNTGYSFGTTFPIPNPEALKGKKIRASGIYGEFVKRLGGSPVVVAPAEMYMALKLGTIDGCIFALDFLETAKLKEVWTNYLYKPNFSTIMGSFIINMDSFKKLPEDLRAKIENDAAQRLLENTMNNHMRDLYFATKATKEYPFKLVYWSEQDIAKARQIAFELWDDVAKKSPRNAMLVDIVKTQMKEIGKMK